MPVDYAGFKLKPHGFFDRNPTIDVPDLNAVRACCADGDCHCGHGHGGHGHNRHGGHSEMDVGH